MTRFVVIPGAGGAAWYWSYVVDRLRSAGHDALAVDLPGDDETAGLDDYSEMVLSAIGGRPEVILVAQSLGGFTAAQVAARTTLAGLVFVNAMIPRPGETAGEWWGDVGAVEARDALGFGEFDERTHFLHDVPAEVLAEAPPPRPETDRAFQTPCQFDAWPSIPIRALVGADDRFFPCAFQRRVARDRLGLEAEVIPGGHLVALSQPDTLAAQLLNNATSGRSRDDR
jgi:pimeloyl-ACP methyl ester carboxylesterase